MLKGKVALITGSSKGIGKAIAETFASNRCDVIINYNSNVEKAKELVDDLKKFDVNSISIKCDVSDASQVKEMFTKIRKTYGKLDILVNNAGVMEQSLILMTPEYLWDKNINTNLKGSFNCLQQAAKLMMRKKSGKIINMSSIMGTNGDFGNASYSASKSGIVGLTKSAAKEFGGYGINVNAIAPGFVKTDLTSDVSDENKNKVLSNIVLKKLGEPKDIAKVALFLASDLSDYVTGQILGVDGGMMW